MAAITRLAAERTSAELAFPDKLEVYNTSAPRLVSVVASNLGMETARVYIFIVPAGTESMPDSWAFLAYNLPLTGYNTYETFRFGLNATDSVYVSGSANVSYFVQGIAQ